MAFVRKEPSLLPFLEGRIAIIGPGLGIVLEFRRDFFRRPVAECQRPGLPIPAATGVGGLGRWFGVGKRSGDRRDLATRSLVEIGEKCPRFSAIQTETLPEIEDGGQELTPNRRCKAWISNESFQPRQLRCPTVRMPCVRYTIRGLMVLVAAIAVLLAWLADNINWDWSLFSPPQPVCSLNADP
jgi:hypothetical protein